MSDAARDADPGADTDDERTELLALARSFGRLGLWERDVRTLRGRWDAEVWRLWGLAPREGALPYAEAAAAIVEEDRAHFEATFTSSLQRAGRHACRYRVRGADGVVRHLHSQWLVKNGPDGQPARVLGLMVDDTEIHRLAQERELAESQLQLAAELSGIGIWRHDLRTQRMHYDAQCWRVIDQPPRADGLSIDEVRALIHPGDLPQVLASAAQALATDRPTDMEARYRRRDGAWRHVMTRRVVQRDADGAPVAFLGVALDVSERAQAMQKAAEWSARFELVSDTAGIGYWNSEPGAPRATWSPRLRAIYGLAEDAPAPTVGEWLRAFVHPEDRARVHAEFVGWLRQGREDLRLALRIVRTDGQVRQVLTHSHVARADGGADGATADQDTTHPLLFGVVVDLTDSRSATEALRTAEQRVALAVHGAGLATWEHDVATQTDLWDAAMWTLRGHPPQARAMTHAERLACVHPDDRAMVINLNRDALAEHQPTELEFRVIWPDGQVRWLASRALSVFDDDGRPLRRIGVNWDITDSRTAAAAQQAAELARRESQAKSRFLSRMSHELRTPLNAVLGFGQLLQAEETGADAAAARRRERLMLMLQAGRHLLALIDDVLDLSALEGGELSVARQPVALAPLLAQALALLAPPAAAACVQLGLGRCDATVLADERRLRQVLLNLVSNAIKYNRPGGRVDLDAQADGAGHVQLRVADTGRGMSEQQLARLYEPFDRLGAEAEGSDGTGIGLTIVKSLLERMDGRIEVRSTPGVGTTFTLTLPVAASPAEPPAAAAPRPEPALPRPASMAGSAPAPATLQSTLPATQPAAPPRVHELLYIEDHPVNAELLQQLLATRPGLRLHVAPDGRSGLEQARTLRPALVLLDMQLPDIDGFAVLRALRADPATAALPVIALSADALPDAVQRAREAGVADYWTKPLDLHLCLAALDARFGHGATAAARPAPR